MHLLPKRGADTPLTSFINTNILEKSKLILTLLLALLFRLYAIALKPKNNDCTENLIVKNKGKDEHEQITSTSHMEYLFGILCCIINATTAVYIGGK